MVVLPLPMLLLTIVKAKFAIEIVQENNVEWRRESNRSDTSFYNLIDYIGTTYTLPERVSARVKSTV